MVQFNDDTHNEERAVEKLFRCIPEKYKQMARSIESLLDLSMMSIEEAIGRLKVVNTDEPQPLSSPSPLAGSYFSLWSSGMPTTMTGRGSPLPRRAAVGVASRARRAKTSKPGHKVVPAKAPPAGPSQHKTTPAQECRQPRRSQAHVAQTEGEEPTLFMAHASIELPPAHRPLLDKSLYIIVYMEMLLHMVLVKDWLQHMHGPCEVLAVRI
jgi:hypothetical protein